MVHHLHVPYIPGFRKPLTANPPKHKALLIGINYASSTGDNEQGHYPVKGPVNDAKEMMKALIEVFRYEEEDIRLMSDEEANRYTSLWPSEENIIRAMCDLVCDASPGDAFVFLFSGHSGQQLATTDPNEIDGLDEYIVTCDYKTILDSTLRECLVDPLPAGTRLTAILDSCHSGTLLDLDHYLCHWFLHRRAQSLFEEKAVTRYNKLSRRYSEDFGRRWLVPSDTQHLHQTFSGIAFIVLAAVRFKLSLAKKQKQFKVGGVDHATLSAPGSDPRTLRGSQYTAYALLNGPVVISLSSSSDQQSTWEYSHRMGQSMTTKLIKILRKNPSVKVGDLDQQLKKSLSKMAFKRLREIKSTFKMHSAKLSPETQKELEEKFTNEGLFEFKELTAQIGSLHHLRLDEEFIA